MTKNCAIRRNPNNHGSERGKSSGCPQGYPQDLCKTFRINNRGDWQPGTMMVGPVDGRAMTSTARRHRSPMDENDACCTPGAAGGGRMRRRR